MCPVLPQGTASEHTNQVNTLWASGRRWGWPEPGRGRSSGQDGPSRSEMGAGLGPGGPCGLHWEKEGAGEANERRSAGGGVEACVRRWVCP